MTRKPSIPPADARMTRLLEAAALHRDLHLARIASIGAAIAATRAAQAAIERDPVVEPDPALHAAALRHDIWAAQRRTLLRQTLERQQADLARQRVEAARALARHETLQTLLRKRRP